MSTRLRRLIGGAHRAAKVDACQSEDKPTRLLIENVTPGVHWGMVQTEGSSSIHTELVGSIAWRIITDISLHWPLVFVVGESMFEHTNGNYEYILRTHFSFFFAKHLLNFLPPYDFPRSI